MSNPAAKQNPFLGCFELSIFMKSAFSYFKSDKKAFLHSFIIPFLSLPLLIWSVPYVYSANTELQLVSLSFITNLFLAKEIFTFTLSIGLIYIFCKFSKRLEHFITTITIFNWAALIGIVLFIPIAFLLQNGSHDYDALYPAMVIASLYSYAISAFILRHCLQIPWELACFLTVCGIAINEGSMDLLNFIVSSAS